ncbi:hypothetical protein BGZ80_000496 [Entomortierella chlamydospora]|uniref:TLC domain-containing protein n=1 Tax=Entomortierella chlamydospora TaxID=101097 RepID=A0A9P6MTA7_9FUNG|nr:hypothetical protein BGZ80_000496 [Entomortierella chlamydospora]
MTIVGTYLLITVDWSKNDISTFKSPITPFLVGLELGYLTQDTAFEFYQRIMYGIGSNLILFHHVAVVMGSVYYLHSLTLTNPGPYFIGMLSLMNLSTPLLHLRWVLQSRGQTFFNSRFKRTIDTSLLISYFWCRVFGNWWMGVAIGTKLGVAWYQVPWHIGRIFTVTTTVMFLMNLVWWLILAKQWLKSVQRFYFAKQPTATTTTTTGAGDAATAKKLE